MAFKGFLEPLNHGNMYIIEIDQIEAKNQNKNRSQTRASIFTTTTWEFLKEASVSQLKYLQTLQNKIL